MNYSEQLTSKSGPLVTDSDGPIQEDTYLPKEKTEKQIEEEKLEKIADEKRSRAQQKESFKFIFKYARAEACQFGFGFVFLLFGSVGDFVVPYYIGKVITALGNGDFDVIGTICLHMFLIISVSSCTFEIIWSVVCRSVRWHEGIHL